MYRQHLNFSCRLKRKTQKYFFTALNTHNQYQKWWSVKVWENKGGYNSKGIFFFFSSSINSYRLCVAGTVSASHIAILTAAIVKISYLASSHVFHYLVRWPKGNGRNGFERCDVLKSCTCYFRFRFLVLALCLSFTSHFSPFILDPLCL